MHSLEALANSLDARTSPVTVFFRDDDAGWGNDRLHSLCELFGDVNVELDLAVIPAALDQPTSAGIIRLSRRYNPVLNFHQHGYAHINHQAAGRKCEFGTDRCINAQREDIELGRKQLHDVLGELVDPIFTPPWNRCTSATCRILKDLDFAAYSRIVGSGEIEDFGLVSIPVTIDWQKKRGDEALSWAEFCSYAGHHLLQDEVVGVMLHHEKMSGDDLGRLREFIAVLRDSGKVRFQSMLQVMDTMCDRQKEKSNVVA